MAKKILVIEDDLFLRDLLTRKLKEEGYETLGATEGEDGVKKAKEEKPDLILLDLVLPGIDGFEVLKRINKESSLTPVPVIIISNLGQKEEIKRGLEAGAADYLVKAYFTPGEIISKIKAILGG